MAKIPQYAAHVPPGKLVVILCKGDCGRTAFAELEERKPHEIPEGRPYEKFREYNARCLRCGKLARDNYNWSRP